MARDAEAEVKGANDDLDDLGRVAFIGDIGGGGGGVGGGGGDDADDGAATAEDDSSIIDDADSKEDAAGANASRTVTRPV